MTNSISNTAIAKALVVLEDAGLMTGDSACDLLGNWLYDQGTTLEAFNEAIDNEQSA